MKTLEIEELKTKLKDVHKGAFYYTTWITDVLPVGTHTDAETGEKTALYVTVTATALVRFGIKYSEIKSVKERAELAARTATTGKVYRTREVWFKHVDDCAGLVQHKNHPEQLYVQMFKSHAKNIETGEFRKPEIHYVFMMGTPDEEVLTEFSTEKGKALLEALAKKRPAHEKPDETWLKPVKSIIAIGSNPFKK